MKFAGSDAERLEALMRWRRDVRHFRPDPLPEDVKAALGAALDLAPSVGNSRPWRVIEVASAGARAAVAEDFEARRAEAGAIYGPEQRARYDKLRLAGVDAAPLQLAVFTDLAPAAGHGLGRQTMPETLEQSTAMAIHTLWLAARARNIGLGMVSILDPRGIERLLGVPSDWRFSAYLCLGYPVESSDQPLLHREGWQANAQSDWRKA